MTKDVQIGLARPEELNAIWGLYQRTYLDAYVDEKAGLTKEVLMDFLTTDFPYFPKNWEQYLKRPNKKRTVYLARHNDEVIGMVAPVFVNGKYRITALYVAPEAQHMKVGTRLMEKALSHQGNVDVYIGIASHVKGLQKFYEPFGFSVVEPRRLRRYLPDPMSYIEMMRPVVTGPKLEE